jgi:hypothetical protein
MMPNLDRLMSPAPPGDPLHWVEGVGLPAAVFDSDGEALCVSRLLRRAKETDPGAITAWLQQAAALCRRCSGIQQRLDENGFRLTPLLPSLGAAGSLL